MVIMDQLPDNAGGMRRNIRHFCGGVLAALLLTSCSSAPEVHSTTAPPLYLEMQSAPSASTVHFPPGLYTLESSDRTGSYYRAPRALIKHAFGGSQPFDGGVFVDKRDHRKLRGYIIWAGGRTKIGNFSRTQHAFRN